MSSINDITITLRVNGDCNWFSTRVSPEKYKDILEGHQIDSLPFHEVLVQEEEIENEKGETEFIRIIFNTFDKTWSIEYV